MFLRECEVNHRNILHHTSYCAMLESLKTKKTNAELRNVQTSSFILVSITNTISNRSSLWMSYPRTSGSLTNLDKSYLHCDRDLVGACHTRGLLCIHIYEILPSGCVWHFRTEEHLPMVLAFLSVPRYKV